MNKHSLINSALLAVCLAVAGWVGKKTADTGERLVAVQAGLDTMRELTAKTERSYAETLQRLERKLDETLPRREFEARLLLIENEVRKQDLKLREIDLEILKLKAGIKTKD